MEFLRSGSILWVDLSTGKVWKEPTSKYDKFIGGRGINTKIVYDHVGPSIKAYDPGNVIVFGTGPLTGTLTPGAGRTEITAKSPMNELLGMSNMGGYWATELKYAGYDHLAVTGRADMPVYLAITDDRVEIRDAGSVWGKDTYEVTPIVRREMGEPDAQVLMIGPAGENLVRYANVLHKVGDAAGKTGMGAVMGSKNLKAVAVRGTGGVKIADPDGYLQAAGKLHSMIKEHWFLRPISEEGTLGEVSAMTLSGLRVAGNMKSGAWDDWDHAALESFHDQMATDRAGCFSCPVRCMDYYHVPGVGSSVISCAVYSDPLFKVKANDPRLWYESVHLCQRYGIDWNTVYSTISWASDMFERGLLTREETGGLNLEMGSRDTVVTVIEKIAHREGIGDLLADGPVIAARRLGRGTEDHVYHTKGMPHQSLNQMTFRTRALATAVGPRGDFLRADGGIATNLDVAMMSGSQAEKDHYHAEVERLIGKNRATDPLGYEDKGRWVAYMEKVTAISDLLMHCKWHSLWQEGPIEPAHLAELYSLGTGTPVEVSDLWEAAERVRMLERAYNLREGLTREDDSLPSRYFEKPLPGKFPADVVDWHKFEKMKDEYYREMGLDEMTGLPSRETLEILGLPEVAADLEKAGRLAMPVPVEVVAG